MTAALPREELKLVIQIRTSTVSFQVSDDAECFSSTIGRSRRAPDIRQRSTGDDEFATARQSVAPLAIPLQLLLSSVALPVRIGQYHILRILGEGEMGSVFLAHDTHRNRRVAIKIPKFNHHCESIDRFEREARVMAKLRHPNICSFYHSGELGGTRFFAMAYIEGKTLAEHLADGSPLSGRQVAMLVIKLALALDTAHRAGVTHRDLKPANIMIEPAGEPVIMDFGLAKLENSGSMITKDGKVLGTPAYMPPEQVKGRCKVVGPASDIYSLGVVMYEMLAGRIPFTGRIAAVLQ